MPPIRQSHFGGGEIAPEEQGHTASANVQRGLATCRNGYSTQRGRWVNRPGFQYVGLTDPTCARLVPFIFSDDQSFVIELGSRSARFWSGGQRIENVPGTPYQVATPWSAFDVPRLKFTQVGDIITVTHHNYPPQEIKRLANNNWTITAVDFANQAPWLGASPTFNSLIWDPTLTAYDPTVSYGPGLGVTYNGVSYRSLLASNKNNQPDISPIWWALDGWSSAITYGEGDFVYDQGVLFVSLAAGNLNNAPSFSGATAWWQQAIDSIHLAREWEWTFTFLWKDQYGTQRESKRYSSAPKLVSPTGKFPISRDRPARLSAITAPLGLVSFNYQIIGIRWYRGRPSVAGLTGIWGWIADQDSDGTVAGTPVFKDEGQEPDYDLQPPTGENPFDVPTGPNATTRSYPAAVGHYDQRRMFARSDLLPAQFWGSHLNDFARFETKKSGVIDEADSFNFKLAQSRLEDVRSMMPHEKLLLMTGAGLWAVSGAQDDAISAVSIKARKTTGMPGGSWLDPLAVNTRILYQTARGSRIFDIGYDWRSQTYSGEDVVLHGRHLVEDYSIVDWCYQEHPHSVVWAVRSDGVLLSLTYDVPQQGPPVLAWARHDTGLDAGDFFERVCCVPQSTTELGPNAQTLAGPSGSTFQALPDAVYAVVNRRGVRMLERLAGRVVTALTDVRQLVFLDQSFTGNGVNTNGAAVITASGATYNAGDIITVTASGWTFGADPLAVIDGDVVFGPATDAIRARVVEYTDATHLKVVLADNLPLTYQAAGTTNWGFAYARLPVLTGTPLEQLGDRNVSVLADGAVQAGPFLVPGVGGYLGTFDPPALYWVVGLPYNSDGELLDLPSDATRGNVKSVDDVYLEVVRSRGFSAGQDFDHLIPAKLRQVKDQYGNPALITDRVPISINGDWNINGRACWRQSNPLPLTVNAAIREVSLGGRP